MDSLNNIDFKKLASQQKSIQMKMRLLALAHFKDGHSRTQIAKFLKVSRTSVNKWVQTFLEEGLDGLKEKPRTGRPPLLTPKQREQLSQYIKDKARDTQGGRLTGADIHAYIVKEFGKYYHPDSIYYLLNHMGFAWITSRSKHPQQSQAIQEDFKKFKFETILKIPGHIALKNVDIWFQDEARFGQQNTTTRLWAERGTRPRAVKQQQFEYAYLFGSICPQKGIGEAIVVPWVNKDIMIEHLKQISSVTEKGRHAIVIMDGAGWHTEDIADDFQNISIIKLPPYSPELNPIEQVWSWLRQHYLANQSFSDYEDIVSKVCSAWNSFLECCFLECSTRVTKMCSRRWTDLTS
ncbi:IS630 family transposase [Photobacterium damselae subsp. damselae]|nr:IS630 family transposase [Photobacterium damselae]MBA5683810.1 IS630 family transposase [Photobacterium damselae subsp. damselae]NVH50740.1 IS630 family transposase [Photobacterium damselae subsp. damselae]NVO79822.1 IS630 family transposase [Photobacterium damselae subsp. damselae]TLS80023.1 IS630 family transposase [Photobacterium damselae subsp. damselae]TLS85207.1 IS630 family transposase [Photobacterium damselae subsp. damselae]